MEVAQREILREPITDASAWTSEDLRQDSSWLYYLTPEHLREIDAALHRISDRQIPLTEVTKRHFQGASLECLLEGFCEQLEHGRGIGIIRGLPFDRYNESQLATIFWGIGQHIGQPISQNAEGHLLGHVRAIAGKRYGDKDVRGYQTNAELSFHNDNSDIVSLLCLQQAKSGGVSCVLSAMTLYNEVLAKHPEYLDVLNRGFYYDLRGEQQGQSSPVTPHRIPVYSYYDHRLSCRYVYTSIMQAVRRGYSELTPLEIEALEFLNRNAVSDKLRLDMLLEPGEMQFLNNHVVLHSRTEYEEWPDVGRQRHMLRLWLSNPEGRELAPEFADRHGEGLGMGVLPR